MTPQRARPHKDFNEPPTSAAQAEAFRKDIRQKLQIVAILVLAARDAGSDDPDSGEDIAMMKQ